MANQIIEHSLTFYLNNINEDSKSLTGMFIKLINPENNYYKLNFQIKELEPTPIFGEIWEP